MSSVTQKASRHKGFRIGQASETQSASSRKVKQIKQTLIRKAELKRKYFKEFPKAAQPPGKEDGPQTSRAEDCSETAIQEKATPAVPKQIQMHPARQAQSRLAVGARRDADGTTRVAKDAVTRPHYRDLPNDRQKIGARRRAKRQEDTDWRRRRSDGRIDQASRMRVLLSRIERASSRP